MAKKTKTKKTDGRSNRSDHRAKHITDEQICAALTKTNGLMGGAASILAKSRAWMSERCNESEKIKEHLKQLVEDRIDRAEQALDGLLASKNTTACIFTLKTLGHKRGYVERAPVEEIDSSKFKALSDFFGAIGKVRETPLPSISDVPKGPDSLPEKTSLPEKDLPLRQSDF